MQKVATFIVFQVRGLSEGAAKILFGNIFCWVWVLATFMELQSVVNTVTRYSYEDTGRWVH